MAGRRPQRRAKRADGRPPAACAGSARRYKRHFRQRFPIAAREPGRQSAALTSVARAPRPTIASAEARAVGCADLGARARARSQAGLRGPGKATSRPLRRRGGRRLRRCRGGRSRRRREPGPGGAALAGVSNQRLRCPAPDDRLAGEGLADRRVGPLAFARLRGANDVVSIAAHGFERRQAGVERLVAARPVVAAGQALGFRRAQRAAAGQDAERHRGEGRWTRARRPTTSNSFHSVQESLSAPVVAGSDGAQSRPVDQAPESWPPPGQHRVRGYHCPCSLLHFALGSCQKIARSLRWSIVTSIFTKRCRNVQFPLRRFPTKDDFRPAGGMSIRARCSRDHRAVEQVADSSKGTNP